MKHTIRFIILFFSLVIVGAGNAWAADITVADIIINVQPNSAAGTVSVTNIQNPDPATDTQVTITVTPATGYSIDANHIIAEKMVDPAASRASGLSSSLPVSGTNPFSFTIPAGYTGAYVTVNFFKQAVGFTQITSLSQITDMSGSYQLTTDVSGVSSSLGNFTGTLDGGLHKIIGLSAPLFTSTDGAVIRNIIFEDVNISESGDAGAVTKNAGGNTRIYNCGINPSSAERDNEGNITGFYGSTVSGSRYVGSLVGFLDGSARVINCYSYANISGGTHNGGIVGYNNVATVSTTAADLKTMVMNCMFYGNISGGSIAPIYNGTIITNDGDANGVNNFNYFWSGALYVKNRSINVYNCALSAETRYLQRFEFFRHLLNSNRGLAAWWATGNMTNKDQMMKWVMEPSQISSNVPFPILKPFGKYPSVVNIDVENATTQSERNKGGDLGDLTVYIQNNSGGDGSDAPTGASITTSQLTLNITDKDPEHFNFNYYKVQLPYYNDVGSNNYIGNRVVTGWKIVKINGQTTGTGIYSEGADATATVSEEGDITLSTPFNFADRKNTNKDFYDVSGRVFNQGAYWDVPEGVTSITIEPYWAKAVYVSDQYADVVYHNNNSNDDMNSKKNVSYVGGGSRFSNNTAYYITDDQTQEKQIVYTSISNAVAALGTTGTVYDNAVVLVGNTHTSGISLKDATKSFTIMSIDLDHDNEPDYSYILRFNGRNRVHPVRVDFLNIIGLGMAQKTTGGKGTYNFGILQPLGWFESTNTSLFRFTQFEYDVNGKSQSPMILQGGVIEQWVTYQNGNNTEAEATQYYHVGGNVWFKEFQIGCHQDRTDKISRHTPISVTGGEYESFYLTGFYNSPNTNYDDNAECYINGGHFGKMAGTGMQGIGHATNHTNGNIIWQIDNADIDEFYAGGINAAHIAEGNITTVISNSRVDQFCGGPKFGNMNSDKKVVTNATNCIFRTFFGAGYGGNSYNRRYPTNQNNKININWNSWVQTEYTKKYDAIYKGVETRIDYQFLPMSSNVDNVCRLFVDYVSFSLATTHDVTSKLNNCTITKSKLGSLNLFDGCIGNFYGGGSLGKVDGPVKSTLTNCTIEGSVFGAGYSATLPSVAVMNNSFQTEPYYDENLGAYMEAVLPATTPYTWAHKDNISSTSDAIDNTNHILYTTENLSSLGTVSGKATLNIEGTTTVAGSVYGGGEESGVDGSTEVTVTSGTIGAEGQGGVEYGNVYGGGKGKNDDVKAGLVKGHTKVAISNGRIYHNVYGGGAYGSVGDFEYNASGIPTGLKTGAAEHSGETEVYITGGSFGWNGKENGMVFGSSRGDVGAPGAIEDKMAWVYDTHVAIGDTVATETTTDAPIIRGSVYGGGENGHNLRNSCVRINGGTIGIKSGGKVTSGGVEYEGAAYPYRGNVYGGGCGTDMYYTNTENVANPYDGNGDAYNPLAGIVQGNSYVNITAGDVARNVYGAGAMGSVGIANTNGTITNGQTVIDVSGGTVGVDGKNGDGNVFGAARGDLDATGDNLAQVRDARVTISSTADIKSCVYGGGEAGIVKDSTEVYIYGGSVNHSVYGGGCLADVLGNTRVEMTDGYIFNGIFGGGYSGSVGTYTRSTAEADVTVFGHTPHEGCIGRPMSCTSGGRCTVIVTGGQVGPIEVATEGMTRRDANGWYDPVEEGWIWGGGRGLVQDPTEHKDTHFTAYVNETDVTIGGDAFILESIIGGGEFGRVLHDTHVKIQDHCQIGVGYKQVDGDKPKRYDEAKFIDPSTQTITDADTLAMCSSFPYGYDSNGDGKPDQYLSFDQYYDKYYDATTGKFPNTVPDEFKLGSTSHASDGKTWIGVVFGGGSGYMPSEKEDGSGYEWVSSAGWVGGNTNVTITGGHILTNVYGANEYTDVEGKSTVKMSGGTIGVPRTLEQIKANPLNGNLFGGGKGDPRTHFNTVTNVDNVEIEITGGIIYGSVYGGGEDGHVIGDAVTTIKKETGEGKKAPVIGCNKTLVNNGNVFGGGQGSPIALTAGVVGGNITLNIEDGLINGSVYGGGEIASVGTYFAMANDEKYGKMQDGDNHGCINVNLKGGTIEQNVYGGCMGTTENPALGVSKNVAVELNNGVADNAKGCAVKGSIFGCNNVNSSPEGTATVHIYKTQRAGQTRITNTESVTTAKVAGTQTNGEYNLSSFDLQAVYGGGNMAAYVPKADNGSTNVIIDGCSRTSIGHVYGGGNAASTPATNVEVNGTFEIGELFGGGNGKDSIVVDNVKQANPGANVGYKDYHLVENNSEFATKEARVNGAAFAEYRYGTGEATVNIKGGTIHRVFGGSNTKGNVRKTALTMLEEVKDNGDPICSLHVDEAYGGGKSAPMDAEAKLLMACIPGLKEVYGGAQAADVNDDVTLNITNGTFDRVFGGNNLSGTIRGNITVNIEETGCRPVIIGELYGGGNQAAYSIFGYNSDGTIIENGTDTLYADPQVNVKSFTSIGTVYGGGYGAGAVMVGSPHVNINVSKGTPDSYPTTGDFDDNGFKGKTITVDGHEVTLPAHEKGSIGAINNVFGGGNAAKVKGNTYVNIGTEPCEGVDIRGDVYGGGNAAEVTGSTNVTIGKENANN